MSKHAVREAVKTVSKTVSRIGLLLFASTLLASAQAQGQDQGHG